MKRIARIDGQPVDPADADIVEAEPGVYSVLHGGDSWEVSVSGDEIAIGPHRFQFEADDPRQWKRSGHSGGAHDKTVIKSAMPGKVVRILVSPGDEVKAGQGIMVVEAMKMQNELKSPRDGRITSIDARPGDSVNAGAVLASIE